MFSPIPALSDTFALSRVMKEEMLGSRSRVETVLEFEAHSKPRRPRSGKRPQATKISQQFFTISSQSSLDFVSPRLVHYQNLEFLCFIL
jgi:hypothetical protein